MIPDLEQVALIKAKLLKAKCSIISEDESSQQVAKLLFEPSEHRSNLLSWIANLILNLEGDVNANKVCEELGFPTTFLSGSDPPATQLEHWKFIIRMMESEIDLKDHPNRSQLEDWSRDYQQSLLRDNLAAPTSGGEEVVKIPRSIEEDVKPLETSMTQEQFASYLSDLKSKLEDLAKSPHKADQPSGTEQEDPKVLILRLQKAMTDFDQMYKTNLKAWVDRVPTVNPDPELNSATEAVLPKLQALLQSTESNQSIRESVSSITSNLRSLNDLES